MSRPATSLALLATLAACHGKDAGTAAPATTAHAAVPAVAAGAEPVLAAALWPAHFPAVLHALAPLEDVAGELGLPPDATLWAALGKLGGRLDLGDLALPPPGVDESQPVALEVFAPAGALETTALAILGSLDGHPLADGTPSPRVRLTLPARDPKALAAALRHALAKLDAGPDDTFASHGFVLRLAEGDGAVAIDVVGRDDLAGIAQLAHASPPAVTAVIDLPGDSAARLVVLGHGAAELGAALGMANTFAALGNADPTDHYELLAEGTGEVLAGTLVADPATSFARALIAEVPADPASAPRLALVLTDAGKATLAAAGLARDHATALAALAWPAAIAAAPVSPILEHTTDAKHVVQLIEMCGWSCWAYLALGNAAQLAHGPAAAGELDGLVTAAKDALGPRWDLVAHAELTWRGELLLVGAGPAPAAWAPTVAPAPAPSPAEACYRRALVGVQRGLLAVAQVDPSARRKVLAEAGLALAGATSCVAGDAALAARHHALSELLLGLGDRVGAP